MCKNTKTVTIQSLATIQSACLYTKRQFKDKQYLQTTSTSFIILWQILSLCVIILVYTGKNFMLGINILSFKALRS